jgi:hypothetical protein
MTWVARHKRFCSECRTSFVPTSSGAKYCGEACARVVMNRRNLAFMNARYAANPEPFKRRARAYGRKHGTGRTRRLSKLAGQRFNSLTVIRKAGTKSKQLVWLCRCDCGNTTKVLSDNLRRGHTRSCGCLQRESRGKTLRKDLVGRQFGIARVVAQAGSIVLKSGKRRRWKCICACDRVFYTTSTLTSKTRSCGCQRLVALRAAARARRVPLEEKQRRRRVYRTRYFADPVNRRRKVSNGRKYRTVEYQIEQTIRMAAEVGSLISKQRP